MEKRFFNSTGHQITIEELSTKTTAELLNEYNCNKATNGESFVKKFADRATAVKRTWSSMIVTESTPVKPTIAEQAKNITEKIVAEKAAKKSTTVKTDTRILKSTKFTVNLENIIDCKIPQVRMIISLVNTANNSTLTKAEIISKLDECGYKQSGEKIFAWYQKELIQKYLLISV